MWTQGWDSPEQCGRRHIKVSRQNGSDSPFGDVGLVGKAMCSWFRGSVRWGARGEGEGEKTKGLE